MIKTTIRINTPYKHPKLLYVFRKASHPCDPLKGADPTLGNHCSRIIPLLIIIVTAHCHLKQSSSGRSVLSQLFIIWTDKGTIRPSKTRWVKCTKVKQPPSFLNQAHAYVSGSLLWLAVVLKQHRAALLSLPSYNRVIDRSLSAMNGCKGKGGKTLNFR